VDAEQKIGSNDLGTGLRVGRHNLRGTVSKEIFEGGGQERELAAQYRKWAQASAAWPRVARVLSVIADSYGSEAGAEDARAEQDKLDI
jgi:hypothetical protein